MSITLYADRPTRRDKQQQSVHRPLCDFVSSAAA